jgi:hypothetical protein
VNSYDRKNLLESLACSPRSKNSRHGEVSRMRTEYLRQAERKMLQVF